METNPTIPTATLVFRTQKLADRGGESCLAEVFP